MLIMRGVKEKMTNMEWQHLIFFDGVCELCNSSIDFILKRDKKNLFRFASLQSEEAKEVLLKNNYPIEEIEGLSNIVYLRKGEVEIKSTAVLFILWDLAGWYRILSFCFIIPTFARDWIYDIIAKNRYRWFGKKETCRIPTPNEREKFLKFRS